MNFFSNLGPAIGMPTWLDSAIPFLPFIILWSIFWKGLALWHSGRRSQHWWFIAFLFINTAGILEIAYLFGVAKLKAEKLFSK